MRCGDATPSWRLAIGELFAPSRTRWPTGSFELRYFNGNYLLQICEASPTYNDLQAFGTGAVHIALYFEHGTIFFLFRIAGFYGWSDQAFSIHLLSESDRGPGDRSGRFFVPLSMVLVDADTGKVAAIRVATMSPQFAQKFQALIDEQRATPFSHARHNAAIRAVYSQHPSSRTLAACAPLCERAGSNIARR